MVDKLWLRHVKNVKIFIWNNIFVPSCQNWSGFYTKKMNRITKEFWRISRVFFRNNYFLERLKTVAAELLYEVFFPVFSGVQSLQYKH